MRRVGWSRRVLVLSSVCVVAQIVAVVRTASGDDDTEVRFYGDTGYSVFSSTSASAHSSPDLFPGVSNSFDASHSRDISDGVVRSTQLPRGGDVRIRPRRERVLHRRRAGSGDVPVLGRAAGEGRTRAHRFRLLQRHLPPRAHLRFDDGEAVPHELRRLGWDHPGPHRRRGRRREVRSSAPPETSRTTWTSATPASRTSRPCPSRSRPRARRPST